MFITSSCTSCPIEFHGDGSAAALVDHYRLVHKAPTVRTVILVDRGGSPTLCQPQTLVAGCDRCQLRGGPIHKPCTNHGSEHCSAEGCF